MKKLVLFFLVFTSICNGLKAQQFYNNLPSALDLSNFSRTDVLEMNNAYYKIETETNDGAGFHANIRIIKMDTNGMVIWAKRYDAGIDSSFIIQGIAKTNDNNIVVLAELDFDNSTFPPMGLSVLKLDTSGVVLWSVLVPGYRAGDCGDIIQLQDSFLVFSGWNDAPLTPAIFKLNTNSFSISAKLFQNAAYISQLVTSLALRNDTFSLTLNYGEFITTDTAFNVLQHKLYTMGTSLGYIKHLAMANGDYVIVDDIVPGGLGTGIFRVFRVDANANLLWAKNVSGKFLDSSASFANHFDALGCDNIMEDALGNIVVLMNDENYDNLAITFDAGGNLLYNKTVPATTMKISSGGDFLCVKNSITPHSFFSKQLPVTVYECDSALFITTTPGTDSMSSMVTTTSSISNPATVSMFHIYVSDTTVTAASFCNITTHTSGQNKTAAHMLLYPDPAADELTISLATNTGASFKIFNLLGAVVSNTSLSAAPYKLDVSKLPSGVYILEAHADQNIMRQKFIKQ